MPNSDLIKRRLSELGMTQAQLAHAISMAAPTINQKINNLRPFTLDEAEKVATLLKIDDSEFGRYFFNGVLRSAKREPPP